ncbi:MAG TPA: hypothetical protein V6D27_00795 [Vampirovibrionales bacterium]
MPLNINAKIPSLQQIVPQAKSKLDRAQATVNAVKGKVEQVGRLSGQIAGAIDKLEDRLPQQFKGYTQESLDAFAEVNGAIGDASSNLIEVLEKADKSISKARKYGESRVRLVDWLLS